jgi:hypothetical protein
MQIPRFACGGAGSILSAAALQRMDMDRCMRLYHSRCMQSDWMIGGCARMHNVTELRALGCGTCDPKHLDSAAVRTRLSEDRCFFLQNVPQDLVKALPLGRHAGAVVHTSQMGSAESHAFFMRHARSATRAP